MKAAVRNKFFFSPSGILRNPSVASMGTSGPLDNLAPDGFTWANCAPIILDKNNNLIITAQDNTGNKDIWFIHSGNGTSWTAYDPAQPFLRRGSMAYDQARDMIHVLWVGSSPTDGVIYRRYTINYTGSAISSFTRDTNINLQLDFGASEYEAPVLIFVPSISAIVAMWSAWSATNYELRMSMRALSYTIADNTAANWKAVITAGTDGIGTIPAVPYSKILTGTGQVAGSFFRKPSGTHASDLYLFYHTNTTSGKVGFKRASWNSGASDWSTGLGVEVLVSNTQRAGTDTGYNLKHQLITQPAFDSTNDRVWVGFSSWKSNASGDTWGAKYVDASDVASGYVDAYSVGGAHSFAPTGDIVFDVTSGKLVTSYAKTTTQNIYVSSWSGITAAQGETLFASIAADIPLLYQGPRYGSPAKLVMVTRDHDGTPPYQGWSGTMLW